MARFRVAVVHTATEEWEYTRSVKADSVESALWVAASHKYNDAEIGRGVVSHDKSGPLLTVADHTFFIE